MRKVLELVITLALLFAFSWVLNFVWESFHAVYLYEGHNFIAGRYIPMLLYVSTVDGILVAVLYLAVSGSSRNLLWIVTFRRLHVLLFLLAGVLLAGFIEYRAVYLSHKWAYQKDMPTVFGLGLSPLVQLSSTGIASLWLTRVLLYGKGLFQKE